MKRFFVFLVSALTLAFVSVPQRSSASIGGDAALLAQQYAQYLQDAKGMLENMDNFSMILNQIELRQNDLLNIENTFSRVMGIDPQNFEKMRKVCDANLAVIRTTRELLGYYKFIVTTGNEVQIRRAYYIYTDFQSRTKVLLNTMKTFWSVIASFRDASGTDYVANSNLVQKEYNNDVIVASNIARHAMSELTFEAMAYNEWKQNRKVAGITFY